MLTRSGWTAVVAAVALVVVGRVLGIFELFLLGAAALALTAAAVVSIRRTALRLDVSRTLQPPRVHAGTLSRVELTVRNRSTRRTPVLALRDPVGRGQSARVVLSPLGQGETLRAAYRMPTERRGIVPVGPLVVEVTDPFGLASLISPAAPVAELTVWPAVVDVDPLPHTAGDDPHGGVEHPHALAAGGEDFYALRAYQPGDDLRRVHWRSTARRGDELLVRQDERPWQARATILLDARRAAHSPTSFEAAVSAAASIALACWRRRFLLRLVDTTGHDSGFASGATHIESFLEHLAKLRLSEYGHLAATAASLRRPGNGGACAAVLGDRSATDLQALARLRPPYAALTVVAFPPSEARRRASAAPSGSVLEVPEGADFAAIWNRAARARRRPMVVPG